MFLKKVALMVLLSLLSFSCVKSDYVDLFNGVDLEGWEVCSGKAPYSVENGAIVGTYVTGTPNTFLCSKEKYGDFILTFDAWLDEGTNSGMMFRGQVKEGDYNGNIYGYQMELDPSKRAWTAGIFDEARRGWLYNLECNTAAKESFKLGEWNSYRIEAIGNSLRTWINGIPAADVIDDVDAEGIFGIQVHACGKDVEGRQVKFKNLKICTENLAKNATPYTNVIPQKSYLTNTLSGREVSEGWALLWDGKTTEGWRGAKIKEFPTRGWQVKDGMLMVEKSDGAESGNGGDIVTTKKYKNFVLEVDFRLTKAANSGIKYFVDTELNMGKGSSIGCEFQILDDQFHPDAKNGKDGNRTLASLYDLITANAKNFNADLPLEKRVNKYEWNRATVVVNGADVAHYLNGIKVVEYNRSGQQWRDQVAASKYKVWPNFGENKSGHILLQDHGDEVYFKNVKIKEL